MVRTQAAVVRKKGAPFQFEEIEIGDLRKEEILVRMVACGICHTDIAVQNGRWLRHFPCVLGHEGAGIVEEVGKGVTKVQTGDHVLLSFSSCGQCNGCRSAHPARCSKFDVLNINWAREDNSPTLWDLKGKPLGGNFFGQSSFSYFSLTHERNAVVVKATLEELALFAPLGCGMQAGSSTVLNELKPQKQEIIAIFGVGAVGLAAVMAAKLAGVDRIVAIDIVPSRLKLAKKLGAHSIINSQTENVSQTLKKTFGRIDKVVETTGNSKMINAAIKSLATRGEISSLAISSDDSPIREIEEDQTLIDSIAGDSNPQEWIPFLIKNYKKGKFPFDQLIRFYPVSEINKAVKDCSRGKVIKPVLLF